MLHFSKQLLSLVRDSIFLPTTEQILLGDRLFRPFMRYQRHWMQRFYPHDTLSETHDSWFYLQKYVMPLIKQHASSYHIEGIKQLGLDSEIQPPFADLCSLFHEQSAGFKMESVTDEIEPLEYFALIRDGKFPCIAETREKTSLFCGNAPDFWHETIGHIAPLCSKTVQDFYLSIAEKILSANTKRQLKHHIEIAWTITEYGFLREQDRTTFFGAALVGSHLAHMRYQQHLIGIETATRDAIITSRFAAEETNISKDTQHRFRFFCLDNLTTHPALLFKNEC